MTPIHRIKSRHPNSRSKQGRRADLGNMFFRSSMEANVARYLNFLVSQKEILRWDYEPTTFWFSKIRRGVCSYKPDFCIHRPDETMYFLEVKGWMDPKSATKLKRMKKYYPDIQVELIDSKRYAAIRKSVSAFIPGWE
jgi:hypothetical protein